MFAAITSLGASGTGVTGIFGILLCLNAPLKYILMFVITVAASFILTWMFGYKDEVKEDAVQNISAFENETEAVGTEASGELTVGAPLSGSVVTLQETGDETFGSEVLGKGFAIEPTEGKVKAPCAGTITALMGHAIGMECDNGVELLIHIGIDTVRLEGRHYTPHIEEGRRVEAGQLLMEFDILAIQKAGYRTVAPVIVTNAGDYAEITGAAGNIREMETLMTIRK